MIFWRPYVVLLVGVLAILLLAYLAVPARAAFCAGQLLSASWYGAESGNRTANGEYFDGSSLTAAHRTLPFGTRLRVSYKGQSVLVVVNDRGPYSKGRGLDLSRAAAARIGMIDAGVALVCVERE